MLVRDTFRGPRAATGEDDRCGIGRLRSDGLKVRSVRFEQLFVRRAAPENSPTADGHVELRPLEATPVEHANRLHDRDRDKALGLDGFEAVKNVRASHAGIDQHRHCTGLEQSKRQRDELKTRPHHQHESSPRLDPHLHQSGREPITLNIKLLKREMRVSHPSGRIASLRKDDGTLMRHQPSGLAKPLSNVDEVGHQAIGSTISASRTSAAFGEERPRCFECR